MTLITPEQAVYIGNAIGVDWRFVDMEEFRQGIVVELEHGARDPQTNVINDNPFLSGKIALAHLKELPDYYTRLGAMERADAYPPAPAGVLSGTALFVAGLAAGAFAAGLAVSCVTKGCPAQKNQKT